MVVFATMPTTTTTNIMNSLPGSSRTRGFLGAISSNIKLRSGSLFHTSNRSMPNLSSTLSFSTSSSTSPPSISYPSVTDLSSFSEDSLPPVPPIPLTYQPINATSPPPPYTTLASPSSTVSNSHLPLPSTTRPCSNANPTTSPTLVQQQTTTFSSSSYDPVSSHHSSYDNNEHERFFFKPPPAPASPSPLLSRRTSKQAKKQRSLPPVKQTITTAVAAIGSIFSPTSTETPLTPRLLLRTQPISDFFPAFLNFPPSSPTKTTTKPTATTIDLSSAISISTRNSSSIPKNKIDKSQIKTIHNPRLLLYDIDENNSTSTASTTSTLDNNRSTIKIMTTKRIKTPAPRTRICLATSTLSNDENWTEDEDADIKHRQQRQIQRKSSQHSNISFNFRGGGGAKNLVTQSSNLRNLFTHPSPSKRTRSKPLTDLPLSSSMVSFKRNNPISYPTLQTSSRAGGAAGSASTGFSSRVSIPVPDLSTPSRVAPPIPTFISKSQTTSSSTSIRRVSLDNQLVLPTTVQIETLPPLVDEDEFGLNARRQEIYARTRLRALREHQMILVELMKTLTERENQHNNSNNKKDRRPCRIHFPHAHNNTSSKINSRIIQTIVASPTVSEQLSLMDIEDITLLSSELLCAYDDHTGGGGPSSSDAPCKCHQRVIRRRQKREAAARAYQMAILELWQIDQTLCHWLSRYIRTIRRVQKSLEFILGCPALSQRFSCELLEAALSRFRSDDEQHHQQQQHLPRQQQKTAGEATTLQRQEQQQPLETVWNSSLESQIATVQYEVCFQGELQVRQKDGSSFVDASEFEEPEPRPSGVSIDELERMGILQTKLLKLTGTLYSPKSYASQLLAATAAASSTTSLMTTTTITTTNNNNKKSIPVPTTVQDEDLHYESDNDNDNDSDAESVVLPREDDRLRKQIAQACYPSRREEYRKRKKERQQPTQLRRSTRQQPRQSRLFRKSPSPVQQQQRQQHQQSSSRTSEEQKRKVVAPSSPTGINLTTVQWNRPFANPSSALLCCSENACYPDEDLEKPLPPLPPLSPPPPREVATQTSATANPPSSSYAYSSSGSVSVDENACFMVNEASLSSPVSSSTPSPSGGDTAWSQVPPMPSLSSIAQYQSIPFHYQPQFPSSSSSRLAAAVTTPTVLNTYQIGIQTAQQLRPIINTTAATVPPKMATLTSTTTATTTTATTSSSSKSRPVLLLTSPTIVHRGKSIRNSKRRNTTSRRSQRRHQQQILLAPNSNPIAIALLKQNSADRQDGEWVEEGVVTEEMSELELAVLLGAHLQTLRKANQFLEEFDRQALASQQGMDQFTRAKEVYERWLALFLSSSTTTSHSKATTGPRSSSLPIYRRRPTIRHATQVQYLQEQKLLQQQQRYHLQLKQLRPLPPVPTTEKRKSQHIRLLQQQQQLAMLQQYREQQELDLQFRTQQQHVRQKSLARRHTRRSGHRTTVSSLGSGGTVSGRTSRTATKRQAKK